MLKWIALIISIGAIILSIGLGLLANSIQAKNLHEEAENNLQFFNVNLPSTSDLAISCENPDFKIEILGAYFDVFDPWGQCSPEPSDLIGKTCREDADNNKGLCSNLVKTIENKDSLSSQWFRNTICGSRYQEDHGYGGEANNKQGNNTEPIDMSDFVCRLQDATAFLSARCNGKKECIINLQNPDEVEQVFGSLPCYHKMSGVSLNIKDSPYKELPSDQNNNNTNNKSFQQGNVVKGLYRCVPS